MTMAMSFSSEERDMFAETRAAHPAAAFAIDNRVVLEALQRFVDGKTVSGSFDVNGGTEQAAALLELARENGLDISICLRSPNQEKPLIVHVPEE